MADRLTWNSGAPILQSLAQDTPHIAEGEQDKQMATIDIKSAITGTATAAQGLKPGMWAADFAAHDVIDAPGYVPSGSHENYEIKLSSGTHAFVFGESIRPGALA